MRFYRSRMDRRSETPADRARRFRWRIRLMTGAFAVAFLCLAVRAVLLMAVSNERLETLARRQHRQVVNLYPKRGIIYDRNGAELARSVEMDSIYADPKFVSDPDEAAAKLAPLLGMSESRLRSKLTQKLRFVWLARRITPRKSEAILAAKVPGIYSVTETRRFYPNREMAAGVIGFTGIDNIGLEGIERAYNEILNGKESQYVRLRDAKGRNITPDGVLVRQNIDGCHLVLTLDRTLQFEAEQALNDVYTRFNAKGGFLIVMDPRTGEILAMANAPGYNPNVFGQYDDPKVYRNQAVTNCYEPGSTQKTFLLASAFNDKIVRPNELIDCEGGLYRIGRSTVHDSHEHGLITAQEVLKFSSNIGASKIADRLGKQRLYDYYRAFGFGRTTRSGLPGEVAGLLRQPKTWSRIGLATHGFGQGMAVTGIQVASALSTIANGGIKLKPYIIKEVKDQFGEVLERNEPQVVDRVISEETAKLMTQTMTMVTEPGGTGTNAAVEGFAVAGKTGTAQKVDPKIRRYGRGMYTSSFIGFLPAEDPRLVIVSVLDEPHGHGYYGGTVAAPAFARVARAGMRYLGVAPTVAPPDEDGKKAAKSLVARVTIPEGVETASTPEPEPPLLKLVSTAEGEPEQEEYVLPDFSGQTMRSVLSALDDKLVALQIFGSGVAVAQEPAAGEAIRSGGTLKVTFDQDGGPKPKKKGRKR